MLSLLAAASNGEADEIASNCWGVRMRQSVSVTQPPPRGIGSLGQAVSQWYTTRTAARRLSRSVSHSGWYTTRTAARRLSSAHRPGVCFHVPHLARPRGVFRPGVCFYVPHLARPRGVFCPGVCFHVPHLARPRGVLCPGVCFYVPHLARPRGVFSHAELLALECGVKVSAVVVILYVARYVASVLVDTWLGAASMPAS